MTYDDAVSVVEMLLAAFPNERAWDAQEIRMYAEGIGRLDAAVATRTMLRARDTITRRPSVSDFLSIARSEEATMRAAAAVPTRETREKFNPRDCPHWVREWLVARAAGDFRRFRQQGDWVDPRIEEMPEGLYAEAAKEVSPTQVMKGIANAL